MDFYFFVSTAPVFFSARALNAKDLLSGYRFFFSSLACWPITTHLISRMRAGGICETKGTSQYVSGCNTVFFSFRMINVLTCLARPQSHAERNINKHFQRSIGSIFMQITQSNVNPCELCMIDLRGWHDTFIFQCRGRLYLAT